MNKQASLDRVFSELDHARLFKLSDAHVAPDGSLPPLFDLLDEGGVIPPRQIPPDVVTMHSRVLVTDEQGEQREITLCYPHEADLAAGKYSVLSPIGTALLGMRARSSTQYRTPNGKTVLLRIDAIRFQPEAWGNYLL
ncbi:hypothetical protein FOZ76_09430 [Verticiella sediminum]|uniref:Transcription elongation factor GreA/GreB C-terminal domain-containing protein n=1 Tax=Verticiella sediminum TaxID=1247510 RepID=A0A556AU38_9BURK|nr:GreA/GreB family elongation factor [Verticiella sediminum]TSH96447.1 hypothetical protein FOZ76_09430 [Verticiella sediminum]